MSAIETYLRVSLRGGHAAMVEDPNGACASILRNIAAKLEGSQADYFCEYVRDLNGYEVGYFEFEAGGDDDELDGENVEDTDESDDDDDDDDELDGDDDGEGNFFWR